MSATPQTDRARATLKAIDPARLDAAERAWYALAQANSPFWLDRVRAADYVGDQLDNLPVGADTERRRAVSIAETLFTRLPVQLAAAEGDRLHNLADAFEGEDRWVLEAQLRGREAVEGRTDTPLDAIDPETATALEEDALPLDGFALLVAAWRGEEPIGRPLDALAASVVDTLVALGREDRDGATAAFSALLAQTRSVDDGRRLRPVALVFGRALESMPDDDELRGQITSLARCYAERAPRPGYGFAQLAAALFDAGLREAGAHVTRRALDEGERASPGLLDGVVARSLQWAVRDGSDRDMLEWLDLGERRFES
jgi:hypothetical protein